LRAGDHLLLRAGDYERGLPLHHLAGEPGRPIVIEGEMGVRFLARPGSSTVSLLDVSHLVIRNLELDGRNLPVDAVKAEGHSRYAHYITLENLYIHDHAASQQNVGISSKCPTFGWVVRDNRIERVGTGMYFGDSDGSDPFVAGLIEGNRVSDTTGYNLQIKHQMSRPADLPESDRDHDSVIRHNVFAKETAWPDHAARPNVLIGHAPLDGPGSRDRVLVYGNLFWQNPSEALLQGEGHLAIYNNLFVNSQGHALHIQPHNDVPRQVDIFHNTVLARGHGIRVLQREGAPPAWPQRVLRNLVFAAQPISGGEAGDNLIGGVDSAARYLKKPYTELGQLDLTPRMTLAGEVWPNSLRLDAYPDSSQDFDGRARMAPVLGACIAEAEMPCPKR
ncbi:MAG: right-handed parallel beta-helix repeat-containing protein, partial [Gammaproteobacteria bacterium]|nr:right-handed parallel beta-helix repeat-containing protein [Gammaproteobacteria bacterium]